MTDDNDIFQDILTELRAMRGELKARRSATPAAINPWRKYTVKIPSSVKTAVAKSDNYKKSIRLSKLNLPCTSQEP